MYTENTRTLALVLATVLGFIGSAGSGKESGITVTVTHIRSENGKVACAIWDAQKGFPKEVSTSKAATAVSIKSGTATCRFHVPPGLYAVAVYHDENDNGKFDTNFLGIPTEGHGASNDAQGHMGPPKYKDAQFRYVGGDLSLQVEMHY